MMTYQMMTETMISMMMMTGLNFENVAMVTSLSRRGGRHLIS